MQRRVSDDDGPVLLRQLQLAREGDTTAFGQLIAGFRQYLLAVAHRELDDGLRGRVGPSDLVQETFLQAQRRFEAFSGASEAELRAWLCRILINRCRDLRDANLLSAKRDARREVPLDEADSALGPIDGLQLDTDTPSQHAAANEDSARLVAAMGLLPAECRQVVWLRNWEGLNFDEIGRRTNRTGEAARKMFSRSIQKLGNLLRETDGDERPDDWRS